MKPKVFVTRPLPAAALEILIQHAEVTIRPDDKPLPAEEFIAAAREVEGLLVAGVRVTPEVLKSASKLRAISNAG
ncbi:MAG: hypothetical protein ACM3NO_03575, partial [Deltaproteobacteria bacterium]